MKKKNVERSKARQRVSERKTPRKKKKVPTRGRLRNNALGVLAAVLMGLAC